MKRKIDEIRAVLKFAKHITLENCDERYLISKIVLLGTECDDDVHYTDILMFIKRQLLKISYDIDNFILYLEHLNKSKNKLESLAKDFNGPIPLTFLVNQYSEYYQTASLIFVLISHLKRKVRLLSVQKVGKLNIVLEGLDGSGKTTIIDKLKEEFKEDKDVLFITEPSVFGLSGKDINAAPYLRCIFYHMTKEDLDGKIIISDRSFISTLVYSKSNEVYRPNHIIDILLTLVPILFVRKVLLKDRRQDELDNYSLENHDLLTKRLVKLTKEKFNSKVAVLYNIKTVRDLTLVQDNIVEKIKEVIKDI